MSVPITPEKLRKAALDTMTDSIDAHAIWPHYATPSNIIALLDRLEEVSKELELANQSCRAYLEEIESLRVLQKKVQEAAVATEPRVADYPCRTLCAQEGEMNDFPTLDEFTSDVPSGYPKIGWVKDGPIKAYMRITKRHLGGPIPLLDTLEIGNVCVVRDKDKGKGHFTRFLARLEKIADAQKRAVYIECIMEPRLGKFLLRRGYLIHPHVVSLSVYRLASIAPAPVPDQQG